MTESEQRAQITALRPILITGTQRSGTTWVGEVFRASPLIRVVHEPFNHLYREAGQTVAIPTDEHFHRVRPNEEAAWTHYLRHRLQGPESARKPWGFWSRQAPTRPLMKDPIALLSTEWLVDTFGAQALVLVRHPAAYVSSILRMNWRINLPRLAQMEDLLLGPWAPIGSELRARVGTPALPLLDEACLVWRLMAHLVCNWQLRRPDLLILRHEDLSREPTQEFERIAKGFDLPWSKSLQKAVQRTSDATNPVDDGGKVHQLVRDSRANIKLWQKRLEPAEIARIREATADVWPKLYSEEDW